MLEGQAYSVPSPNAPGQTGTRIQPDNQLTIHSLRDHINATDRRE
jgi:hypothetical protein